MGGERVETGSSSRNNPLTQKDLARARAELKAPPGQGEQGEEGLV